MREYLISTNMASASEGFASFSQFKINGRPVTKLKVDELKQELIARGLEKSGLKKELQERLCKALAKEQNNAKDTAEEKPSVDNDETSSQEVSSTTTDVKEMTSVVEKEEMPSVTDSETPLVVENNEAQSVVETEEMPSVPDSNKTLSVVDKEEMPSVADTSETPSVVENNEALVADTVVETKESDSHGEVQETEDKKSLTNNEENKDEKEVQVREAETTDNKNKEEVEDGEITGQEDEKKDIQKSGVPEKRRRISLTRQTTSNPPTPGTRKRKWSSNKPKSSVVISTDSLKDLIPGVQLASTPALEAVMELDDDKDDEEEGKEEKQSEEKKQENKESSNNKLDEKSPYKKRIVQVANSKTVKLGEAVNEAEPDENDVVITATIQPSDDAPTGAGSHDDNQSSETPPETRTPVKREVSPPRNPPSCALHVSNLVRPFTQKQLVQYLSQFGAVTEEGFWMNKIKSHCYVIYSSVDEATNARQSLHGERWPSTSPKTLRADFADNAKMLEDTDGALGKKTEERTEEKTEIVDDGKERSRSREKSSQKQKEKKEEKKKDEPTAANLLDKLFRKTTAVPCIYWLPLTNEQVVIREREREERRRQRQLAMEEENKTGMQKPRDVTRKPQEKPREMDRPKPREIPRDPERRPLRDNRESSPPPRQRPDRRPSPPKRRSRSPAFRRAPDRRR